MPEPSITNDSIVNGGETTSVTISDDIAVTRTITNNVPRLVIDAYELSAQEREEFDYIDWTAVDNGETSPTFFRYRGQLYDLGDFVTTAPGPWNHLPADSPLLKWDGYSADSFFSAVVVRYVDDFERVIVGLVLS